VVDDELTSDIQTEIFWDVTPCSVVAGYQRFGGQCYPHFHPEYGGRMDLLTVGILPQRYRASQSRTSPIFIAVETSNLVTCNIFNFFWDGGGV
jgi:hypothetical protein